MSGNDRPIAVRWLLAVVLVGGALLLIFTGALDFVRDQDRIEDLLDGNGVWGPVGYVAGFTALQPLSLPGALLIVPATFVWPWWKTFLLTLLGGSIASVIGFSLARWLGQDWVAKRLPDRFAPWQERLEKNGLVATIFLRVVTGLAPPADWLLGVSRVKFGEFFVGTVLGLVPLVLVTSLWGDDAVRLLDRGSWVLVPLLVVAGIASLRKK